MNSTCQTWDSGGQTATVSVQMPARPDWSAARHNAAACMVLDDDTFEELVGRWYESLYRFALSLTRREADARDLTQETFHQLARKAGQIRDKARAKSWLFTTLYRAFVDSRRWGTRYPHVDVEAAGQELPSSLPTTGAELDAEAVRSALLRVDEVYRVPLVLFYLEEHSYLEIAEILGVPVGTVMSRLSRGRAILRELMVDKPNIVPMKAVQSHTTPS